MNKRHFFVILSIIAILVLLITASIGCIPKRNTTVPNTIPDSSGSVVSAKDAEQDFEISQLQAKIASQPDSSDEIDSLRDEIDTLQDELGDSQNKINIALQNALNTIDTKIAEWEAKQASSEATSSSADCDEDDIEVNITQPYIAYPIPILANDASHTITFMLSMTLENTTTVDADNIMLMLSLYPQASPNYSYLITPSVAGGIFFTQHTANNFQSWGPISLKSGQKKTYQLSVNILLENKTGEDVTSTSNLTAPVQAYCIDASF